MIISFLVTAILAIMFFWRLIKNKSFSLVIGVLFFIEFFWTILSCAYIDSGDIYISETGTTSYHTGAFVRLLILYLPFFLILSRKKNANINPYYDEKIHVVNFNYNSMVLILELFTIGVVGYCFLDMVISGIPLFSDVITRINFSEYSTLPFALKISGEITFFGMLLCGIVFFENKKFTTATKFFALIILLMSVGFRLLMEYKYQGMYNVLFAFFLPGIMLYIEKKDYKIITVKNIIGICIIGVAFLGAAYVIYSLTMSMNSSQLLFDRIFSFQAHTFWKIDEILSVQNHHYGINMQNLKYELNAVFHGLGEMDRNSGVINIMYQVTSLETVKALLAQGVRFAGSYITVGINTVGYFGTFILSIVLGKLCLFDFKMLYSSIKNREFFILYFAQSLFWDLLDYARVGNFCFILNIKTLITIFILSFIYFVKVDRYKKRSVISYE